MLNILNRLDKRALSSEENETNKGTVHAELKRNKNDQTVPFEWALGRRLLGNRGGERGDTDITTQLPD